MQVPPFSLSQQLADLGPELDEAALRVLRSGQYIGGTEIQSFETAFAAVVGTAHAVGCNSGTDALILALRALGIGAGDEVIMPSYTFVSTANAFVIRGARVKFVDIQKDTMNLDVSLIEPAISSRTKAIIVVHYAGVPCDMDKVIALSRKYGLYVVEDAAQGMMSSYKGRALGTIGDLGTYSFHETKNFVSGQGGCISTVSYTHLTLPTKA